jgi:hypothetical protein
MGGGLMQLVAYGAQDIYLTGNPQITFFKVVYRRHTNFSMESIQQTWNGTVGNGSRASATISRNGDLVMGLHLQVGAGALTGAKACQNPGSSLIDEVELEIGGQKIDKHYGHWLENWAQLTVPNPGMKTAIQGIGDSGNAIGTLHQLTTLQGGVYGVGTATDVDQYIPLQFWFCRNPGLALPLIALQYHEVKLYLTFASLTAGPTISDSTGGGIKLWADYVYLDTDERRRFAQVSHEYLIEQVQHFQASASSSIDLNFNHPVKELIWSGVGGAASDAASVATPTAITAGTSFILKLNGHDRFASRPLTYFTRKQVLDYHSGPGGIQAYGSNVGKLQDSIAVYSFALKPEEHQPSGTCNFSRIDNAQLTSTGSLTGDYNIYAVNYNVLRIMSGMGGLAYSN